ncbi:reverse transcriptase domain-containing protein [Tanacetum coccineum]
MLERPAGNEYYCFLDGFSGYFQIPIDPQEIQEMSTVTYYVIMERLYRRMPFGLCNAPGTFQRCMMVIFHDMIEKTMEVIMDDFLVFGNSFETCLSLLEKMLKRREDINLCLNWEIDSLYMVKDRIVLGHKISKFGNGEQVYLDAFQDLFHRDIKEMKDAFEQNDVYLDEIENQNDLLKDQLLEASLTADIKNLVITSCMEIRNKDLHDEIERISKESNDVSFEVTQGLSK